MACCCTFTNTVDQQFTSQKAGQELERYRRKDAGPTTRLLLAGIEQAGVGDGTLVDVGAGVGALTFRAARPRLPPRGHRPSMSCCPPSWTPRIFDANRIAGTGGRRLLRRCRSMKPLSAPCRLCAARAHCDPNVDRRPKAGTSLTTLPIIATTNPSGGVPSGPPGVLQLDEELVGVELPAIE